MEIGSRQQWALGREYKYEDVRDVFHMGECHPHEEGLAVGETPQGNTCLDTGSGGALSFLLRFAQTQRKDLGKQQPVLPARGHFIAICIGSAPHRHRIVKKDAKGKLLVSRWANARNACSALCSLMPDSG